MRNHFNAHEVDYSELCCVSNFSFHRGASSPEELFDRAAQLGYRALAITDECSLAGAVRALKASEETGPRLILGSRFALDDGPVMVVLARNADGYTQLCRLITKARTATRKGRYRVTCTDLDALDDCWLLVLPDYGRPPDPTLHALLGWMAVRYPRQSRIALALHRGPHDLLHVKRLNSLRLRYGLPIVAVGDVHMHRRSRRALQDVFTALRLGTTVQNAGHALAANGERYLRPRRVIGRLYPPDAIAETRRIADACDFKLRDIRYDYPAENIPPGHTSSSFLRAEVKKGYVSRGLKGSSWAIRRQLMYEIRVIERLGYPHYFLTVYAIVCHARSRGILCQGRGSSANSIVCYCLQITEVDPIRRELLFERFISEERAEPPDIDVDFEHERREEVIQHIYRTYGRSRAALAATVIRYRPRSAMRDVGRAMGLSVDQIDTLAGELSRRADDGTLPEQLAARGVRLDARLLHQILVLVDTLIGFPRHLSQHVGGFVLSDKPLEMLVPVENAAMPDRTIIQWDKDDLEAVGLMKIDILALGMLTCIRRCFDLIAGYTGYLWRMSTLPSGDPETYRMIQRADTVGVFQIESRAQMTMLPRLKPKRFFDLVVEVAIVRPGPIQGGMVHPYLKARDQKPEDIEYPSEALRGVLERTLGVPIFQEQVMKIAMVAAGFDGNEANGLRKSMAAWKREGGLEPWRERLKSGMRERGYDEDFADRIFEQIKGFGSYGFPESHAISFALLVYVSAYLKCHYPAAFAAALLNSQPMGFYQPAQLVRDARRHGVEVRAADVRYSHADCTLESEPGEAASSNVRPALRLGLRLVKGLSPEAASRISAARASQAFASVPDLVARARLDRRARDALARADALAGLAGHRHRAQWQIAATEVHDDLFAHVDVPEAEVTLAEPTEAADIVADYHSTGLTLRRHPVALLRPDLARAGAVTAAAFNRLDHGANAHVAGIVTMRQRPGSAKGVTFLTLEDESGTVNVIVRREVLATYRIAVLSARLLRIVGVMQRAGQVRHCLAHEIVDETHRLGSLVTRSRDFH
ncbi:error-prone DNA polymerase [Salinisphaera hydrothermalis]|uniref:Error-prone DNA polymerase n=1 Tax=Salinisphaera hydrothermalis (strain C41B8) TaxID=1304275 RepID=A0A084IQF8_SALHC|nr:error-prone DNA polymerase [Salinisphaera hydrothermalis]KEZ78942.1 DNA polymerase III subunit alpha [Salinisphaera hydrothermalis C41B8]